MAREKRAGRSAPTTGDIGMPKECGLCGRTNALIRTECCARWICDDEHEYVVFSYARNSCSRNHGRYTLCGYHSVEGHKGKWQDCAKCRESFETELYVWYGTNEYNFEKMENPPAYRPTICTGCHRRIRLGTDAYVVAEGKYWCEQCGSRNTRPKRAGRDA